jgi:hypothetical protein
MAGWRQAVALAMTGEEIEALTALSRLRVSRDREHGFHCIVSKYFAGS